MPAPVNNLPMRQGSGNAPSGSSNPKMMKPNNGGPPRAGSGNSAASLPAMSKQTLIKQSSMDRQQPSTAPRQLGNLTNGPKSVGGARASPSMSTGLPKVQDPKDVRDAVGKEMDARKAILAAAKKSGMGSRQGAGKYSADLHQLVDTLLASEAAAMRAEKKEGGSRSSAAARGGQSSTAPPRGQTTGSASRPGPQRQLRC